MLKNISAWKKYKLSCWGCLGSLDVVLIFLYYSSDLEGICIEYCILTVCCECFVYFVNREHLVFIDNLSELGVRLV